MKQPAKGSSRTPPFERNESPVRHAPWYPLPRIRRADGFTILEIMIVLFLLAVVLTMAVPRFVIGEDLGAAGRKFIGAVRSLQDMAAASQRLLKLRIDLDRSVYWAIAIDGKNEKPPPDAGWAIPRTLPETIRFTDIAVGQVTRRSGRMDLSFYPSGRIDAGVVHLSDGNSNTLAIAIEPVTGAIRTSDERIEPTRKPTIPDRIKTLLQPASMQGESGASPGIR